MPHTLIQAPLKQLGDGVAVRRALPSVKRRTVGPFVFWDHIGPIETHPDTPFVVRAHPHIGLSTITYLFDGEIMHRDSLGFEQPIRPGEVNWMTAGRGIVHSERVEAPPQTLEGIQSWVALPKDQQETEPSFRHIPKSALPIVEQDGVRSCIIVGEAWGERSQITPIAPVFYVDSDMPNGGTVSLDVAAADEGAIYVARGRGSIADTTYATGSLIAFERGEPLEFHGQPGARVLLFGGTPYPERRHIWWNFVSSSKDRIEQAKQMWRDDAFGQVVNESERIPLPDA